MDALVTHADPFAVILAILGVGLALGRQITNLRTEAAADRRALQSSMDDFRREMGPPQGTFRHEMQRPAERQSHLEGRMTAAADD